jgi:putative endonuclease
MKSHNKTGTKSTTKGKFSQAQLGEIGKLGEEWVAQWLEQQGLKILHQRWRCPQGEIDIIALQDPLIESTHPTLKFIEVKTRSVHNWDEDGRLAVTSRKQEKIGKTAELFLTQYPSFSEYSCQFDVVILRWELGNPLPSQTAIPDTNYTFTILDYIESAFSL